VDVASRELCHFIVSRLCDDTSDVPSTIQAALLEYDSKLYKSRVHNGPEVSSPDTGTTFSAIFLRRNAFWCVQLGDSVIHVFQPQKRKSVLAWSAPLHKPDLEMKRIEATGWQVYGNRIDAVMAVSRGLGDFDFKRRKVDDKALSDYDSQGAMSCVPDIWSGQWKRGTVIWLATDGVVENLEMDAYVHRIQSATSPDEIIEHLIRHTTDDVTLMKLY
jgi:serine/threonine protein phosphatase PrpC